MTVPAHPHPGYRPLHDLPPLAGLGTFAHAMAPGLSVQDCVDRLKRFHYCQQRLWKTLLARLTAEPIYELKMAFSHHAWILAEHITFVRDRVAEMRHPPLGLDKVPDPHLAHYFDEVLAAPTHELLHGLYGHALPALHAAMQRHLQETNALADHPTTRILRIALMELDDLISWGRSAHHALDAAHGSPSGLGAWFSHLSASLSAAGGLDGTASPTPAPSTPVFTQAPWTYDSRPQRDCRFPDPYNMGVHAEAFLYDPTMPARAKTLMMYYKRLREIDVPEMMASILTEIEGKPWGFYREMTRQLWDEARHAMMGEVGFVAQGIDWSTYVMVNATWSMGLNAQLSPKERHAVLWYIEQGLMNKTGKRYEWEVGTESGDPLSRLFQDYDWADEVLHARIGRDWYVKDFDDDVHRAAEYGSACWSKVVSDWEQWRRDGLTEHKNWWPALYERYCQLRGDTPDPAAAAFDTNYSSTRADLQRIAQSG